MFDVDSPTIMNVMNLLVQCGPGYNKIRVTAYQVSFEHSEPCS